jgi:REP-associated tyrosine transposase
MPRKLRLEYEGAIYHVMNRGDRKEDIFLDDPDRQRFLETLGEACQKTGWQIHAFCLLRNHFHLVLETPRANLASGMQWFLGTYTARFNRRHKLSGHLFSGRYKSLIVDGSGDGYLKTVCDYVHLNPARAGLLRTKERLSAHRWSSYAEYLKPPKQRPVWLRTERLLGEWGIREDNAAARRQFEAGMEQRKEQEKNKENGDWSKLRRGWCWGPLRFREDLLEQIEARKGTHHHGEELRESEEQKAQRMVAEMLREAGRLRAETTMTWRWIAERLAMGHWRTAVNAVRRAGSPRRK